MKSENLLKLYHGSYDPHGIQRVKKVVAEKNYFGQRTNLDFGPGFYLTPRYNQAMEWAVRKCTNGSINPFILNLSGLNILNLDPYAMPPLYWIGELVSNRTFKNISRRTHEYIINNWCFDLKGYDVILGYTADDQYFEMFDDFFGNKISFTGLCKMVMLGNLGYQYVIRTEKGYQNLEKAGKNRVVLKDIWYPKLHERNVLAEKYYLELREEHSDYDSGELFFNKIIKLKINPDDERVAFPYEDVKQDDRIENKVFDETEALNKNNIFPGAI